MLYIQKYKIMTVVMSLLLLIIVVVGVQAPVAAVLECPGGGTAQGPDKVCSDDSSTSTQPDTYSLGDPDTKNFCGGDGSGKPTSGSIKTSIDFGCKGRGDAITDMAFAIIRWLSMGVGIVVVASLIVAGVQYSASGGDPQAAQAAMKRIRSSLIALLIFIFAYAILNYVLPGAVLG